MKERYFTSCSLLFSMVCDACTCTNPSRNVGQLARTKRGESLSTKRTHAHARKLDRIISVSRSKSYIEKGKTQEKEKEEIR